MSNSNLPPGTLPRDIDPPDTCPKCYGSGEVEKHDFNDDTKQWEIELIPCPLCGGSGKVHRTKNK